MRTDRDILLTNDDGIDSSGLRSLAETLSSVGSVTVVAPQSNQSAVGRSMTERVRVEETELGYAVDGTPSDCVVAGVRTLLDSVDLVVSGVNVGANLGEYALGRSGTISAAVEASFFDVPAIAVSLYIPASSDDRDAGDSIAFEDDVASARFSEANRAVAHLTETSLDAGVFEAVDYLNVNAPSPTVEPPVSMELTRPSPTYLMDAERDGADVVLRDRIWTQMAAGDVSEPAGTDWRAVLDGKISVSPLTATHPAERHESLDVIIEDYRSA
ncbi:MAG: 5'/3'-nucleotidase SurE [Haloplanus sp.]